MWHVSSRLWDICALYCLRPVPVLYTTNFVSPILIPGHVVSFSPYSVIWISKKASLCSKWLKFSPIQNRLWLIFYNISPEHWSFTLHCVFFQLCFLTMWQTHPVSLKCAQLCTLTSKQYNTIQCSAIFLLYFCVSIAQIQARAIRMYCNTLQSVNFYRYLLDCGGCLYFSTHTVTSSFDEDDSNTISDWIK